MVATYEPQEFLHIPPTNTCVNDFYHGKNIFITGGTGFCGRVMLEKILRSLGDIGTIFVLVRPRRGMTPEERIKKLTNSRLFSFHKHDEKQLKKIVVLEGDTTENNLGLSESDLAKVIDTVDVFFHVAASVKFNATFRFNLDANVTATENIVRLANQCQKISSFILISTAFSNCDKKYIEEKVYDNGEDIDKLVSKLRSMDDNELEKSTKRIIGGFPNTYTYTKNLSESVFVKHHGQYRTVIIRPSVVINIIDEPKPGFIDSLSGPIGMSIVGGLGIVQTIDWDFDPPIDTMPVDVFSKVALSAPCFLEKRAIDSMFVINCASTSLCKNDIYKMMYHGIEASEKAPSLYAIRPLLRPPRKNTMTKIGFEVRKFFYHTLFAYIIDFLLIIFGQKPLMKKVVEKMHIGMELLKPFSKIEISWTCDNMAEILHFMKNEKDFRVNRVMSDSMECANDVWMGIRRNILRESDKTILMARYKYKLQVILHQAFKCFIFYVLLRYLYLWAPENFKQPIDGMMETGKDIALRLLKTVKISS